MFVDLSAGILEQHTSHLSLHFREIIDRRRTSEEEKPDIPVDFNDQILLPEKAPWRCLFGLLGGRITGCLSLLTSL